MSDILTVRKDRVLKTAENCAYAKEILKDIFPEAFPEKDFNLSVLANEHLRLFSNDMARQAGFKDENFLQVRSSGEYRNKAFYLDSQYDWQIVKDAANSTCLVPNYKKEK